MKSTCRLFLLSMIFLPWLFDGTHLFFGGLQEKKIHTGENEAENINSDLEIIRERVLNELLEPSVREKEIASIMTAIREDGSWQDINYQDVSRTGFDQRRHVAHLLSLSHAYRKPGSKFFGHPELKNVISSALEYWIAHDFIADNWHTNEIGNPQSWVEILLLMDGELTDEQEKALIRMADRANLDAWGARPGGDLIKIAGIMAELALYLRDEQKLQKAVKTMAGEIKFSSGNGMKPDFSFHHRTDRVTSILSYGTGYAATFADWSTRLAGTKYNFPEESMKLLIDFYLDGICQTMVHGWYKDPGATNRSMSRPSNLTPIGPEIPLQLLKASNYRKEELSRIAAIRKGERPPDMRSNHFFWHSEYLSHQQPGYFTSVRMFSERNNNMEYPHNEESLKHHHYADGSNFISQSGKEYFDIYPTWDWQKIPGTTTIQKPALPDWKEIVKRGITDFVGAATDGSYGVAAFDFISPHDPLKVRKSWFFFDSEFVCMGAGIQANSPYEVATTLNQCLLNGEVAVKVKKKTTLLNKGDHQLNDVSWVSHDGIAYIFTEPVAIQLSNKLHKGKWSNITNHSGRNSEEEIQKELFTLWLNHGTNPQNATYEYLIVPGLQDKEVDGYVKGDWINILVNTPQIQAVQHKGLNLSAVIFYEAGKIALYPDLELIADQPGIIMVKISGQDIEKITLADPTRKLRKFHMKITRRFEGSGMNWQANWKRGEGYTEINVDLPQDDYAGQSVVLDGRIDGYTGASATKRSTLSVKEEIESGKPGGKHYVGERYGGGVVIWVDDTGEHGLVSATTDQSTEISWRNGPSQKSVHFGDHHDRITNVRGDGIGAGMANTSEIISLLMEDTPSGTFAAKVCADCQLDGYDDWYLPSKMELKLMHRLRNEIGGFGRDLYWSSTEYNVGFAWAQDFKIYGGEYTQTKGSNLYVRCVRKF